MYGSTNPSGKSSLSPFGSQSAFGQTNASSGDPFSPKPSGSTTPFGSQTNSSLFGGTSTGVLGASQSSSPFSSPTTFGASSSPALGNSVPTFGSSSTSALGNSSSSFAVSSVFSQKPVSGGSGSTTQTSPFGSAGQISQPAFGRSIFGSSTPFAASSTPLFGHLTISGVGTSSTLAFGDSSTPSFSFGPTQTVGQSTSAFGSGPFGSTSSPFGGQSSPFGSQATSSAFRRLPVGSRVANYEPTAEADGGTSGQTTKLESISAMPIYKPKSREELKWEGYQIGDKGSQTTSACRSTGIGKSVFGVQGVGSRVANYAPTAEVDGGTSGQTVILGSISAMHIYKDKTHEELRWEDYQIGDKGGPLRSAQSTGLVGFNSTTDQINTFASSPACGQPAPNPFSTPTPSSPFVANSPSPLFSSCPALGTSSPFGSSINFGNSQSSNLFSSAPPTIAQSGSAFGQSTSLFRQNTSAFSQSSLFNPPSSALGGNIFSSSASLTFGQTAPSLSTPLLTRQAAQTGGNFAFSNFGQNEPVGASSYGGTPGIFGQSNFTVPIMVRVVPFQALLFFFFWFMLLLLLFFVFFLVFRRHLELQLEHIM